MLRIVNIIPQLQSGEDHQDSEPNLAVNPQRPTDMVATAFTPNPLPVQFAPIYVSTDAGHTWRTRDVVPGNDGSFGTNDITVGFATSGGVLYAGILNAVTGDLNILRTANFAGTTPMTPPLVTRANVDQPWVVAGTVVAGPAAGQDRVYVGNEDGASRPQSASVDRSLDAAIAAPPSGFQTFRLEQRTTIFKDGPPVRLAVHPDGTVYAAYQRWASGPFPNLRVDIVVSRDDSWASGANPFTALVDPAPPGGNGVIGRLVATNRFMRFNAQMGQERLGGDLTIAVDPQNSSTVWLAWADRVGNPPAIPPESGTDWTIHVSRSTDRGMTWSADLRTITNAKNPSLAINSLGQIGFLFQEFTGTRWVTQLELTSNGWATAARNFVLHTAPSGVPNRQFFPYIGDYVRLLAVGQDFYGVFCGNNTPDAANFPNGVTYQRNANWATQTLLDIDNVTPVSTSVDPFFFHYNNGLAWVYSLYADLLGRAPDAGGLDFWIGQLDAGQSLQSVANGFLQSQEYGTNIITGLYQQLLSRAPDPAGLAGWVNTMEGGTALQQIILGFCDSAEYQGNNPLPAEFVESLYQRLLARASDPAGKQGWIDALNAGRGAPDVINGFLGSQEYCNNRVTDLYLTLLGRQPDAAGLAGWVASMAGGTAFQQIQLGFLTSVEYQNRALRRFRSWVYSLYADLLGRAPDAGGLDFWIGQLDAGQSLQSVANGFLQSQEYGTNIITGLYQQLLSRAPDPAGLAGWVNTMEGGTALQQIILGFCDSAEYQGNNPLPAEFVESLYQRLLARASDPAGKQGWIDALNAGRGAPDVINGFLGSQEYCNNRVTDLYLTLLGRQPDAAGLAGWVASMAGGTAFQQIQLGFLTSVEYQNRALRRVE